MIIQKKKECVKVRCITPRLLKSRSASGKMPSSKMAGTISLPVRFTPGIRAHANIAQTYAQAICPRKYSSKISSIFLYFHLAVNYKDEIGGNN